MLSKTLYLSPSGTTKSSLYSLLICLFAILPVQAQETHPDSVAFATKHYPALQIPQLLWTALVYPLGEFTIYSERTELPTRVNDWFTNEAGTFGLFPQVNFGGETGFGGGLRTFHTDLFGSGKEFEALFIYAKEGQTGSALYHDPNIAGGAFYWTVEGDYLSTHNSDATINAAVAEKEKFQLFDLEQFDVFSILGWRAEAGELADFKKNIYIEGRVGFGSRDFSERLGPGHLYTPFRGYTESAEALVGLGQSISLYSLGLNLTYDDRDFKTPQRELSHPTNYIFPGRVLEHDGEYYHSYRDINYPERGGLLQAGAEFASGSEDTKFWRLTAEAQRFFTLFWSNRILAIRSRLEKVHALGDGVIPFADLPHMGGSQRHRGYERGFFRGEGALLLSAEYRWPIWDTWNAFLFWDEGQVFDDYGEIAADRLHTSYGAGLSLRSERGFLLGLRIGRSAQSRAQTGFSLEQEF